MASKGVSESGSVFLYFPVLLLVLGVFVVAACSESKTCGVVVFGVDSVFSLSPEGTCYPSSSALHLSRLKSLLGVIPSAMAR